MKTRLITHICFLIPFTLTVFNLQVFVTRLVSDSIAQMIAYGNLILLFLGIIFMYKSSNHFSKTSRLWIFYYIIYFVFAILASAIHYNYENIVFSIIPFIYVIGFHYYLSSAINRVVFKKVALITFVLSSFLSIYLFSIKFNLDHGKVYPYLDRSEGVYADANNTALAAVITFILVYQLYLPKNNILKTFKIFILGIVLYGLFITFSTTGFVVFIVVFLLLNYKFFNGLRIVLSLVILPLVYIILINLNSISANWNLEGQQRDKIKNVVNLLTLNTKDVDDSGRKELLTQLLNDYVFENPFLGNGVDFANSQSAHNTIIGVWADAGIFTLIYFLFMLGIYFKRALISTPDIRFLILPMLLTFCVFMLSLQSVINQPYFMALFVYMGYLIDDKKIEK